MKIAVTYENGMIFGHFGHTEKFKFYEVEDGKVVSSAVLSTNGQGHGALAGFLKAAGTDVVICGGIGGGARNALKDAGIDLRGGCTGSCDAAVEAFMSGKLFFNPDVKCTSHGDRHHGEGHDCGSHACGGSCH